MRTRLLTALSLITLFLTLVMVIPIQANSYYPNNCDLEGACYAYSQQCLNNGGGPDCWAESVCVANMGNPNFPLTCICPFVQEPELTITYNSCF